MQQLNVNNPNLHLEVQPSTDDTVQTLSWSPKANFLVAGSWDSKIRCWEIKDDGVCEPKIAIDYATPVLSSFWNDDGANVFVGGCDNKVQMWDLAKNVLQPIGTHEAPVKVVHWLSEHNILMSGGWDKTLKYWDGRQANGILTVPLPDKLYSATVVNNCVVAATAERHIQVYDLKNPSKVFKSTYSPLKFQTRCIAGFTSGAPGYAIGSIEGRVSIQYLDDTANNKHGFAFKCHRGKEVIYSVNGIDFHPLGTFATCGSDGGVATWDKESKQRLKQFSLCPAPITTCKFNKVGTLLAYSSSYDWSMGISGYKPDVKTSIFVHKLNPNEITPKQTKTGGFV